MPRYSAERDAHLLTVEEIAELWSCSVSTVKRRLRAMRKETNVYVEHHLVRHEGKNATRTAFYDIEQGEDQTGGGRELDTPEKDVSLASRGSRAEGQSRGSKKAEGHEQRVTSEQRVKTPKTPTPTAKASERSRGSVAEGQIRAEGHENSHGSHKPAHKTHKQKAAPGEAARLAKLRPILAMRPRSWARGEAVRELATEWGVTTRTIENYLSALAEGRPSISQSGMRKGYMKISLEQQQVIVSALLSNTPETSLAQIQRTLVRAVPSIMHYTTSTGKPKVISTETIRHIKNRLLADPNTAALFATDDEKKEARRVAVGKVFTSYANQLWEMDMTRCDVMVLDEATGKISRPRVHAIIDMYSRAIPGLAFSFDEDQTQTDLALLRALVPKPAPYDQMWPVYGTPDMLYWDNGKTYTSHHADRVCADLGIKSVHSKPGSSHTRGAIERFFGTMHGFERTLPGYVGENAVSRSSEGMKRLIANTERWRDRDYANDPGWGDRLLTMAEYQHHMLNWLLVEYHQAEYEGKPRVERFLSTAPASSLAIPDRNELMLIIGQRTTRVVNALGQIRLDNETWGIADGSLINYQKREVMVIRDQFALGDDRRLIAFETAHTKRLRVIGVAERVPEIAASAEADEWRRAAESRARAQQQEAAQLKRDYTDPNLIAAKALQKAAAAQMDVTTPRVEPQTRRRYEAIDGKDDQEARNFARVRPELSSSYQKLLAKKKASQRDAGKDDT